VESIAIHHLSDLGEGVKDVVEGFREGKWRSSAPPVHDGGGSKRRVVGKRGRKRVERRDAGRRGGRQQVLRSGASRCVLERAAAAALFETRGVCELVPAIPPSPASKRRSSAASKSWRLLSLLLLAQLPSLRSPRPLRLTTFPPPPTPRRFLTTLLRGGDVIDDAQLLIGIHAGPLRHAATAFCQLATVRSRAIPGRAFRAAFV